MLLPVPLPAEVFILDYRPDQALLIARWLRPLTLLELQTSYEAILAAAQAHGSCRHWLLDVRRRATGDPAAMQWFGREFSPRLLAALGGPLFAAYFGMITQDVAKDIAALRANIEQGELNGAHYHYFNREDEALAWLAQQP
jgi:hypothetical protein